MQMRRSDRQITSPDEIDAILRGCKVCRLAMQDEEGLYIVPMNYGFEYREDRPVLYFHGAHEGRKVNAFARNAPMAFEMDGGMEIVPAEIACKYGCRFFSVVGSGTGGIVTDPEEKKHALTLLMKQQTGRDFAFTDKEAASVSVFRVTADQYTAKRRS